MKGWQIIMLFGLANQSLFNQANGLYVFLSIGPFVFLSVHWSNCQTECMSVHPFVHSSVSVVQFVCPLIGTFVCLSIFLFVCMCAHLFMHHGNCLLDILSV